MNVGIIGQGFVGSAIREGLKNNHKILTYDLDTSKCNSNLLDVTEKSEVVFVCVPTPMRKNGVCDTRILEGAIDDLYRVFQDSQKKESPVIIIKSTIPPGTTARINKKYSDMTVLFSPEFLTEANSFEDFKNQNRIIIGSPDYKEGDLAFPAWKVLKMFRESFKDTNSVEIRIVNSDEAEMCKYFINCFLATKVIFSNQMYNICKSSGLDYDTVKSLSLLDPRIGKSHLMVPGPDGDMGFGGHCFPKDLSAMIEYGCTNGLGVSFLREVEKFNNSVRKNRDWEKMKGRAVSDD